MNRLYPYFFINTVPAVNPDPVLGITRKSYLFIHKDVIDALPTPPPIVLHEPLTHEWGHPYSTDGVYRYKIIDTPLASLRRDVGYVTQVTDFAFSVNA